MWGKQAIWDPTTRVPLIISVPWFKHSAAKRFAPFFEMIDLFNTVVDLAGLPPPADVNDGTSAARFFQAGAADHHGKDAAFMQYPRCIKPQRSASSDNRSSSLQPLAWPPSLSEFDDHNPCTTGRQGQRTAFGWMGYSIRTFDWRYSVWLPWNGTSQTADWAVVDAPPGTYQELYAHGTSRNTTDWDSFDTEGENLAAADPLPPLHARAIAMLHARLHAAVLSWNQP